MCRELSSLNNPNIKKFLQLQGRSRVRKKEKLFVVEGVREIGLALTGNFEITEIYFCEELISLPKVKELLHPFKPEITKIPAEVYNKIAYRGSTEGILAVFKSKELSLNNFNLKGNNHFILVAEAPEKPGNIGALLRTADAAGIDAVLIANPKTDIFNPNIIRSSVGCIFTNSIATGSTSEIITFLKERNIKMYAAELKAAKNYTLANFNKSCAIIVGTEATGLSEEWLQHADENIVIPMSGAIDSMNVSVAAGILIFEAKRQRGF